MSQKIYVLLGVSRDADLPRIQGAYRQLVRHSVPTQPVFDTVDEFLGGYVPGVYTTGRTASRRKDLFVELILDSDEAARGGLFPLQVPVAQGCPECDGTGIAAGIICPACRGGELVHHEVRISVPPGVQHGERALLSLADIGLPGVDLNVLVSIAP